jgi:hypothetical protein
MSATLELEKFRENIGHDNIMEEALLRLFIETADSTFQTIHKQIENGIITNHEWAAKMHYLRGAALNITALQLAELVTEAEGMQEAPLVQKRAYFSSIYEHYQQVRQIILSHITTSL